jgi:hypothetical protein
MDWNWELGIPPRPCHDFSDNVNADVFFLNKNEEEYFTVSSQASFLFLPPLKDSTFPNQPKRKGREIRYRRGRESGEKSVIPNSNSNDKSGRELC